MVATRAHTAPSTRPCRGGRGRRVLTPCLSRGLTVCPTPPLSSTGPGAASPSSARDLRRVIQSVRCSWGRCSLHAGPARLPPSGLCLRSPASCTAEKMTGGEGGGHFLSLEAVESGHADHPMPYKSLFPMVPTATAPGGHQREMGGTGDVVWSSDQCGSGVWPLWSIPGARGPPRGRNSRL